MSLCPRAHNTRYIYFSAQCDDCNSHVYHEVENSKEGEGEDVHEDQVEPGHVHLRQTPVTCDLSHTSRFFLLKLTLSDVSNPVTFPSSHHNVADDDYWRCGVD